MLDGRHGAETGLTLAQWRELGATVARVHATPATPELLGLVAREAFRPSRRDLLPEPEEALAAADPADPVVGRLAASWQAHRAVIDRLVGQADRLGRQLADATRRAAVEGFEDLFAPGNIVDLATG